MKFYRYPLALIAYALLFIFLFAFTWYQVLGETKQLPDYWYNFLIAAGAYLIISFILSKLKIHWEWDVLIQVVMVLAPVLWFVNQHEPFKRPVYVFVSTPTYKGKLDIIFKRNKKGQTNAHNPADTLYFKFDEEGKIVLNEEADYVRTCMQQNFVIRDAAGKMTKIEFVKDTAYQDSTKRFLIEHKPEVEKGRYAVMHFELK
jgi:hypothetical protein